MITKTNPELRIEIARRVGLLIKPANGFTLRQLNSIYWYLTGDPYFELRDLGTPESPEHDEIRRGISNAVGFQYDVSHYGNKNFKKSQLAEIRDAIYDNEDKRP